MILDGGGSRLVIRNRGESRMTLWSSGRPPTTGRRRSTECTRELLERGSVAVSDRGRVVRCKGERRPPGPPDKGVRDGAVPDLVRPGVDDLSRGGPARRGQGSPCG